MKKELTEQERYDLAHELYFLAAYLDSEREFYGDEDEEAKYRVDLVDRAVEAIYPGFEAKFWSDVEAQAGIGSFDEEWEKRDKNREKTAEEKEFIQDIDAYKRGELTMEEMRARIKMRRERQNLPDGVIDFGTAKRMKQEKDGD